MPSISVPTAVAIGSAALSAGTGLAQSGAASSAAGKANAAQTQAAAIQRNDLMPWATTGGAANTASADLLGLNGPDAATAAMGNYRTSPGYQWQMSEGLRGVDAGAAAKGMLRSGATLKAEQAFGAGLADSDFNSYYAKLFGMSQLGENAAAGQGAGAIKTGEGIAQTDASAGQVQSSIYGNAGKGLATGINSLFTPDASGFTPLGGFQNANTTLSPTQISAFAAPRGF